VLAPDVLALELVSLVNIDYFGMSSSS